MHHPVRPKYHRQETVEKWVGTGLAIGGFGMALLFGAFHAFGFHDKAEKLQEYMIPVGVGLLSLFFLSLVYGQSRIRREIRRITGLSHDPRNPKWKHAVRHCLPPDFWEIMAPEIDVLTDGLRMAVADQTLVIKKSSIRPRFVEAYLRTLKHFPDATFCATALATSRYWGIFGPPEAITRAFQEFLAGKGRMRRIFFVDNADSPTIEECSIMLKQTELGVEVLVASISLAKSFERDVFFFVDSPADGKPRIAWEVRIDKEEFREVKATVNPEQTMHYFHLWHKLERDGIAKPLTVSALRTLMERSRVPSLRDSETAIAEPKPRELSDPPTSA
jgi:hypothetical protein